MSGKTGIEWTDTTWNPVTGCTRVSPGCEHCYAATLAKRLKAAGNPRYQIDGPDGPGFGVTMHADKVTEPLRWATPRRVFVNSMSDLFHKSVPVPFVRSVFDVMAQCPQHQFQVLTKRPNRMMRIVMELVKESGVSPNVWLGASIENQDYVWRADYVRQTPAAVRFLSIEPLLGPVHQLDLTDINWVIVGGESGARHRPVNADWVRSIRDLCVAAGVPFFFKQWGGLTPKANGRTLDGRTWDEYPGMQRLTR